MTTENLSSTNTEELVMTTENVADVTETIKHNTIAVDQVKVRDDLYPRIKHDQSKAQEYSTNIENLPPILVNQRYELIDGMHRLIAHKLAKVPEIQVEIIQTDSDAHLFELAIKTNSAHGLQMSQKDKKAAAIKLYATGERTAERKKELAKLLSVTVRSVNEWVSDLDQADREARKALIQDMYLKCYTAEEIGEAVGLSGRDSGALKTELSGILENIPKNHKVTFSDNDWQPPIYNIWSFAKKTNEVEHFGNTEQRIVDNLLWLYTQPTDIVIDPFGGTQHV